MSHLLFTYISTRGLKPQSFFFNFVEIYLIYNGVLVSDIQQNDSPYIFFYIFFHYNLL